MTREEAIRQIENRWSIMDYGESEALGEALDMAIEALRREEAEEKWYCHRINYIPKPCEVYEDYEHATLVDIKEPLVKHDREWIIGCIKHDGFIKTDRFDEANQIILDALQTDAIPLEHHRKVLYKTVDQDIEIARLKNRIKELENG